MEQSARHLKKKMKTLHLIRTTLLLTTLTSIQKIFASPTQTDNEPGIALTPLQFHAPDLEVNPSIPVRQHEPDQELGYLSSPIDSQHSVCQICYEEHGTFPRGGACNIDSIIEECRHQPPCTNNPDWECGHVFCRDCITEWKQRWTNTQLNLADRSRHNVRFRCPRCMKEKGCPINADQVIAVRRGLGARLRNFTVSLDTALMVSSTIVIVPLLIYLLWVWL